MSDSTSPFDLLSSSQANKEATANALFNECSPALLWGRRALTTSALTWGYYGGRYGSASISNGSVALTNNATNYIVAARSNGSVSVSTSTTNWNDSANYIRLYLVVTSGGAVTSYEDHRQAFGWSSGGAGSAAGSTNQVQYNSGGAFAASADFTFDGQTLAIKAGTTAGASFRVPHGVAPTTPVNGDLWSTTAGFYGRVNGTTVGPFGAGGGSAAGSTNQVQYNNGGAFAASSNFWWENGVPRLNVGVTVSSWVAGTAGLRLVGGGATSLGVRNDGGGDEYFFGSWHGGGPGGCGTANNTPFVLRANGNIHTSFDTNGVMNLRGASRAIQMDFTQVLSNRITGWGAPTGTISRAALTLTAGASYSQADFDTVIQALKAVITDLRTHGLINN